MPEKSVESWKKVVPVAVFVGVALTVLLVPSEVWAQGPDLGAEKLTAFQAALKKVAIAAIGVAGILAGIYIAFGRQDGNERLGAVIKGGIVVSVIVGVVSYLAG